MAIPVTESATPSVPLRERIAEAAAKVYGEFGFRGATTRRIAEEAGVNEVTLFRTFGSKAALIVEVLERQIGEGIHNPLPTVPSHPGRELHAWAQIYVRHVRARRGLIMQSMGEIAEHPEVLGPVCSARDREFSLLCTYLDALRDTGIATRPYDTVTVAAMLIGSLFSDAVAREMFPSTYPPDAETAIADYVRLILRAIGASDVLPDGVPTAAPPSSTGSSR
ncbi:MAG: TetR/AcrR family transcriptional regulator [Gemmatimonadaceae bacterium]|jgi:AcrR family transcriptional regulator|nr:TetR/AcrR family transcriptional regulator [Gemmatimonadaceae bacterium]